MSSVCIVGLSPTTRELANQSSADEIWTANRGAREGFLNRVDRLFEIHPRWLIERLPGQAEWLALEHPFPIYTQGFDPRIPSSVPYPIEDVLMDLFGRGSRINGKPAWYMTCSVSFAIALAIFERFDKIELVGVEGKTSTEFLYQKGSIECLLGFAMGRGIEIVLDDVTEIMTSDLYGYQNAQMITRQELESYRKLYAQELMDTVAKLNQADALLKQGSGELNDVQRLYSASEQMSGAVQTIDKLIARCDLQNPSPEFEQIVQKFGGNGTGEEH